MNRQAGLIGELILYGVLALAAVAAIAAANNFAFHHYADPVIKDCDAAKALLTKERDDLIVDNKRLGDKFTALRIEVDGITKAFEDAGKLKDDRYAADLKLLREKSKNSRPKIDALDERAKAPTTKTEEQKCKAAQAMLSDYAIDVQKIRDILGITIIGPTSVVPK